MVGKTDWFFPDAYLPDITDGVSHEAVCVLNTCADAAHITLKLYFEDDFSMEDLETVCAPKRTNHIRLDKVKSRSGAAIPQCKPYAIGIHSDVPVLCQYTRVDASLPEHALMTTMGL